MPQPSPQAPIHEDNLREDREVWYLTLPDDEAEIAQHYLQKHDPEALTDERLSDLLHLQRLTSRSAVVVLLRKAPPRGKLTPTQGYVEAPATGERITVRADLEKLAETEMKAYGPLDIANYWERGLTRFSAQIDRKRFLEDLGKLASPAQVAFADVASKKNGDLPDLLQIRFC